MKRKGVTIETRDFAPEGTSIYKGTEIAKSKLEDRDIGEERELIGMKDELIAAYQCNSELVLIWEEINDS